MIHRYLLAAGLAVVLSACGGSGTVKPSTKDLTPEEAVAERVVARWRHIIAGELKAAYEYLTPGARRVQTFEEYARRMSQAQIKWTDVRVMKIECEDAETCNAQVELDIEVNVPGMGGSHIPTQTVVYENWLASGGTWYFLPSQAR